jgi:hypothetical protein
MINKIFIGIIAVAFTSLLAVSLAKAEEAVEEVPVQMGTKLVELENSRMDTYVKYQQVLSNYEYVLDAVDTDTWDVYDGSKLFKGDCEDFAFTMQAMVGAGSVFPAMSHQGANSSYIPDHAVFVYAGMVWELDGRVLNIARYQATIAQILWNMGDITPDYR